MTTLLTTILNSPSLSGMAALIVIGAVIVIIITGAVLHEQHRQTHPKE